MGNTESTQNCFVYCSRAVLNGRTELGVRLCFLQAGERGSFRERPEYLHLLPIDAACKFNQEGVFTALQERI